ncbi:MULTISPECIES: histidine phosphatase family protein [unclassified Rhizobium]|uniref:histidine phosphatase family protein n=1 Tax=unclassified Rhizobium TaxID=2613769 RepID=UPI001AE108EC|nr:MULTISPECIES: histidine phosphatase family protein [unclassified Rhizobium]MBP2462132.1 broad specificity phosphatase PhoE [Rhizobium sp. PvP014]MBP2529528.1 broad specificity phosphatase PhoE [Rhizobium sp. PvP099]
MFLRRQLLIASALALTSKARAQSDPWAELRTGAAMVLLRHAIAPGTGDPANFAVNDCSTQRNLSAQGIAQASRIGTLFREKGVAQARVFSSQWCRCLDTAKGLGLGPVEPQPLLNSFFGSPEDGRPQTQALRAWMTGLPPGRPVVLVTHQVNITGLTNIVPASGELLFVTARAADPLTVIGRVAAE